MSDPRSAKGQPELKEPVRLGRRFWAKIRHPLTMLFAASGLLGIGVTIYNAEQQRDLDEIRLGLDREEQAPQITVTYWLGFSDRLVAYCIEKPEDESCGMPPEFDGFGLVSGHIARDAEFEPTIDMCLSAYCRAESDGLAGNCLQSQLWVGLENSGSSVIRKLTVESDLVSLPRRETADLFADLKSSVRTPLDDPTLSLGDLRPGAGVLAALGPLLICDNQPLNVIPDSEFWIPTVIRFEQNLVSQSMEVREIADHPRVLIVEDSYFVITGG